jgi:cytochrome b involved in lipid metabolism
VCETKEAFDDHLRRRPHLLCNMSCLVKIDDVWYDLQSVLKSHPGGARTISKWRGADATDAFFSHPHASETIKSLEKFRADTDTKEQNQYCAVQ